MPQAITVPRLIAGHSSSTVDTAGLRFELRGDWKDGDVVALYPQIQALCQRSSDPAQFHALALQSSFYPVVPSWRRRLMGFAWRTLLIFSSRQLEAVLFLREGTFLGQPTGYLRGFSAKGETLIVAEAGREDYWLAVACKMLLDSHRAFLILLDRARPNTLSRPLPSNTRSVVRSFPSTGNTRYSPPWTTPSHLSADAPAETCAMLSCTSAKTVGSSSQTSPSTNSHGAWALCVLPAPIRSLKRLATSAFSTPQPQPSHSGWVSSMHMAAG